MSCKHARLLGGGRWASIVLGELLKVAPEIKVDWVCHSNVQSKRELIESNTIYKNVFPLPWEDSGRLETPNIIIIASHTSQHYSDFIHAQSCGAPLLIEKPLFPDLKSFRSLSDQLQSRVFFNLESFHAFFINDFYETIKPIKIQSLTIEWVDPLAEKRAGEAEKFSEIFSSIFSDQFLHVLSICKALNLDTTNVSGISVEHRSSSNPHGVDLKYFLGTTKVTASLSRFAKVRKRKIVVNGGVAELDFTNRPSYYQDGILKEEFAAQGRMYPVSQTLDKLLNQSDEIDASQLSIKALMPELGIAFEAEELFMEAILGSVDLSAESITRAESIDTSLVYFLGIVYYRYVFNNPSKSKLHFLKGHAGVRELINWWVDSETSRLDF